MAIQADVRVSFFWATQWGITVSYVGHATQWDEIIYRGRPEQKQFLAFHVSGGQLKAAAGVNHDQDLDAIQFILQQSLPLSIEQMRNSPFSLINHVQMEAR